MKLSLILLASAATLSAQNPLSTELKAMYTGVKNNLTKMADKMPEEHYAFKATADIRTFGELLGHVADSQTRTCSAVNGDPKEATAGKLTSKADLVAALKTSFDLCDAAFNALTDETAVQTIKMGTRESTKFGALARTTSHSNEEYGYMAVYMRLKGIVPPSSERR